MGLNRYNKYYIKTSCKSIEMKLTTFTESALGTLVYLGRHHHRMVTIDEIFAQHAASRSLLTKVIQQLGIDGWIIATRGCKGGLRLAHEPHNIALGAVVRGEQVIMAHHDTKIEAEDHVIIFVANKRTIPQVEKLFQVGYGFL